MWAAGVYINKTPNNMTGVPAALFTAELKLTDRKKRDLRLPPVPLCCYLLSVSLFRAAGWPCRWGRGRRTYVVCLLRSA